MLQGTSSLAKCHCVHAKPKGVGGGGGGGEKKKKKKKPSVCVHVTSNSVNMNFHNNNKNVARSLSIVCAASSPLGWILKCAVHVHCHIQSVNQ